MGWRLHRYNQELKRHDPLLFAVATPASVQVWRQASHWEASEFGSDLTGKAQPMQFITALTDTWKEDGNPVDTGLEPLIQHIKSMDSWQTGSKLQEMRRRREREKEDENRQNRNEIRAIAADCRKEFAAATNDINTSTLDMSDRKTKYANP